MTRNSYHSSKLDEWRVHSFSCSHFYSHVYLDTNSSHYVNIIIFWITSRTLFQHYLSRIFEELASIEIANTATKNRVYFCDSFCDRQFDVSRIYHSTDQYTVFECCVNFADRSLALYPTSICIKRSRTISFKFLNFAIRAINDCFTSIDNRRHLT